jgi:hypothetical protein
MSEYDAKDLAIADALYMLYYEGNANASWAAGAKAYRNVCASRYADGDTLIKPTNRHEQTLMGMRIVIDPTVPKDTIELRDDQDRIVGKIYNIG